MTFITRIFDPSGFPARWQCGSGWAETPWLGWLHIFSDLGVWSAYLAIPLVLVYFLTLRQDLPFRKIFLLFGGFIFACGTTHLMEAIIFWWPVYRLAGVIKLLTAIVSWATVFALFRVVPRVLAMRSPEELEREIAARKRAELQLQAANTELELRVQQRTRDLVLAAEALHNERELLRTTLESIGDGVIVTDTARRVQFLNGVAEKLTGWTTAEAKDLPLEQVFCIVHEHSRQIMRNPAERALEERQIVGLANHAILIARDGTEWPLDDSAAPIWDESRQITGAVLVFREVTERRRLEKEVASRLVAARQLATIVETSDDAIIAKSLDGVIQSWNSGAERIFGFTAEESVGRQITLIIPEDKLGEEEQIIARLKSGHRIEHFDTVRTRKDGQLVTVSLSVSPIKDEAGQIIGASKILRDITDRKRAEETLRQRMEELQTLLDTLPIGVFIAHDPDCKVITGNRAAHELLRTSRPNLSKSRDVSGNSDEQPLKFRVCRNGVELPASELPVQRAARGEEIHNEEIDDVFEDGTVIHTLISAAPLYDSAGQVRGAVATVLDVTERRQAENALREADHRKDEFLATLAHELRNPLAPIRNGLQIMRMAPHNQEAVEQARNMMDRQLLQLIRLVDDLLDVSRISRGKIELRKEPVPLSTVINSAVETSRPVISEMEHELTVTVPSEVILVDADLTRLAQVFVNLLNNAAKYTECGGHIWLTVERQGTEAVVSVKDTGIGIPGDQLPRIFEMFSQVDRSLEKAQGGLGIGLSLVKRLVEMHGGRIEVRSEGPGKGAEFIVRLQCTVEPSVPVARPASETVSTSTQLKILIVDDNRDSAESLSIMLKVMGNETRLAYDGEEALAAEADFQPDVILLDIGLPKLTGYEVCRRIRERSGREGLIIIAQTGWGQAEDRERTAEAGFDHHLVKPIDTAALFQMLTRSRK